MELEIKQVGAFMRKILIIVLTLATTLPLFAWKIQSVKKITTEGEWTNPAFSPDGTKFFALNGKRQICVFDERGESLIIKTNTNIDLPCWSPDSKMLAAEVESTLKPVAILDVAEDLKARYIGEKAFKPCWSSDGKSIYAIYWKLDHGLAVSKLKELIVGGEGSNEFIEMPKDKNNIRCMTVSPKEATLAFSHNQGTGGTKLYSIDLDENEKKKIADGLKGDMVFWSPDGNFIWTGDELIVMEANTIVSEGMPHAPLAVWSKDSKWLFYSKEDGDLARFDITVKKEEVLITKDRFESNASFTQDGLSAVCLDGKDGNLLLIKLVNE